MPATMLPCPFKVIIDTREQRPWTFEGITRRVRWVDRPVDIRTERGTLKQGDYSVEGYTNQFAIERKSIADIVSTISAGRERFEKELARMQSLRFSAVIIEGEWYQMLQRCLSSTEYNPVSLDSTILTFQMRYPGTHWIYRPGRYMAMKTAYKLMDLYMRKFADM